jgi:hypothetical protein
MATLRYLDPFPLLVVAGVAVATVASAPITVPAYVGLFARLLVFALAVALLVAGYVWLRE